MQIDVDCIKINNWDMKKFLIVVSSIQFALLGSVALDMMHLHIPILRQFIGLIYLAFLPGIIILRILKLHDLSTIETLLYALGLSITTIMFTGFSINIFFPLLGISKPISLLNLVITLGIAIAILSALSYFIDNKLSLRSNPKMTIPTNPLLFLILIPFLAIFGTYIMNHYGKNTILMLFLLVISFIPIFVAFSKFIQKELYPIAIFIISLSLLYHTSLITDYIWGWDVQHEYYLSQLVITGSEWNSTIPYNCNAMLSVVMLSPIYSIICDIDNEWVFKIIYPLIFAFIPLGLYLVYKKQTNDEIAFPTCILFMFMFIFYNEMLQLARQQIAELFFVLLIMIMIDKDMNNITRIILFTLFGFSLAVSHYGLSYIFMFSLIFVWVVSVLMDTHFVQKLNHVLVNIRKSLPLMYVYDQKPTFSEYNVISQVYVLLFITFGLSWYIYNSNASAIFSITDISSQIISKIQSDLLNPEVAQGIHIMKESLSPLRSILKYLYLVIQLFITIGVIKLILNRNILKFDKNYILFTSINYLICVGGIILPYMASRLNSTRLFHISLFFLAPFCVLGWVSSFNTLHYTSNRIINENALKLFLIFLTIFFMFNSGVINELAKDPLSISLNSSIDYPRFNIQEVSGAKWVIGERNNDTIVYADRVRFVLFGSINNYQNTISSLVNRGLYNKYIYLGTNNLFYNRFLIKRDSLTNNYTYMPTNNLTYNLNEIYANGGSEVYF